MNGTRFWLAAFALVALIAAGGGFYLGRSGQSAAPAPMVTSPQVEMRAPIYYQDPDGKPDYSPTPKKTADGRNYKPVYGEKNSAPPPSKPQGNGKILYYRNPMGLPDTSPVPKKDSMGMDYVPVYENDIGADINVVEVSPERVQMLGVRIAKAEMRSALAHTIRATGSVQFDERRLAAVTTKVGGWVERLNVAATGETVRAGQPLLEIYAPELVAAEREYLVVAGMRSGMAHGDVALMIDAATQRLRALDVPEGEIERLRRTGKATRRFSVLAPANGVVTEKDAVLGMRVEPGAPLYKTADLSSVWLIAQVQEQDLGQMKPRQKAHATFVAFPGRVFDGVVDFVYPILNPDTRTAKVRIVIPNSDYLLRSDMYAMVEIEAAPSTLMTTVLAVPNSAIIDSGTRQVVLVVRGEGKFEPRVVRLGARGDGYTQILSGLDEGEEVVTSANFLIDAESNLRAALQSFTPSNKTGGGSQ